jgi:hypothetical protein
MQQANYVEIVEFDTRLAFVAIALPSKSKNETGSEWMRRRAAERTLLTGSVFVRSNSVKLAIGSSTH